jgi:hypothetical protein
MNEDQLRIKKLELEIIELSKPNWKKPSYLTILVSVLTILISATIGFSQYFTKVDQENARKVEELEGKLNDNKEQQHKMEMATQKYETFLINTENEEIKKKNSEIKQYLIDNQNKLFITEQKIKDKQSELQNSNLKLQNVEKKFNGYQHLVSNTINKYNEYSPGYAKGIIDSPSGQEKIKEIIGLKDVENQKYEIERFAYGVMNQTHIKSTEKITSELGIK